MTDILDIVPSSDDKNSQRFGIWIASVPGLPFITGPPERLFLSPFRLKTEARTSCETLWFLIPGTMDSIQHFSHEYDLIPSSES